MLSRICNTGNISKFHTITLFDIQRNVWDQSGKNRLDSADFLSDAILRGHSRGKICR